jgi:diguanylate cyclase (GGDEF)-like protein
MSSFAAPRAVQILLAVEDAHLRQRILAELDGDHFYVSASGDDFSTAAPPDVVLSDQALASRAWESIHEPLMKGEIGVLLIGRALPADVVLPGDFTRRELRLACRLLAQTVHLRRQHHQLQRLANTDSLTGLPNRRAIEEHFRELRERGSPIGLAIFDLDRFKQVNADLGFVAGDDILRAAAKTLAAAAGARFVGRLGGDEFVLLWACISADESRALIEDCRRRLSRGASLKAERPLTASAGVANASAACSLQALLARADTALRRAKEAGGKQTQIADETDLS